jgi:N-methylhydantoinase B
VPAERYAFHNEDGGASEYRGGRGVVLDYRIVSEEAFLKATFGRHKFAPWGMAGGQDGSRNYI